MIMLASPSGIMFPQSQVAGLPAALDAKLDTDGDGSHLTNLTAANVSGNIPGNAANVTGTIAVNHGGTGATDATTARDNLGVTAAIAALVDSAPGTLDTLAKLATAIGNDPDFAATVAGLLALKAPIASPAFTGSAFFQMHPSGHGLTLSKDPATTPNVRVDASDNTVIDSGAGTLWLNFDNRGPVRHFGTLGFFGASPGARPVISGIRSGNVALASLLVGLDSLGLINDQTS